MMKKKIIVTLFAFDKTAYFFGQMFEVIDVLDVTSSDARPSIGVEQLDDDLGGFLQEAILDLLHNFRTCVGSSRCGSRAKMMNCF